MNSNLDPGAITFFNRLALAATSRKYRNHQVIFWQGDPATSMFRIEQGYVKLTVSSGKGKKSAVSIMREGDCFGEGCIGDSIRSCTATSIGDSIIGKISKRMVIRRLHDEPAFAKLFTAYLLVRI